MIKRTDICECLANEKALCSDKCKRHYFKYKQCYLGKKYCLNNLKKELTWESKSGYRYCDIECYDKFKELFSGFGDTLQYQLSRLSIKNFPNADCFPSFMECFNVLYRDDFKCSNCESPYDLSDKETQKRWPVVSYKTYKDFYEGRIKVQYKLNCFNCFKLNHDVRDCIEYDSKKQKDGRWIKFGFKYYDIRQDYYANLCSYINCNTHGRVKMSIKSRTENCPYCRKKRKLTKQCDNCPKTNFINPVKYLGFTFCTYKCYEYFKTVPYIDYLAYQVKYRSSVFSFTKEQEKQRCSVRIKLLKDKLELQRYKKEDGSDNKKSKTDEPYCGKCHKVKLFESHFDEERGVLIKGNITFERKNDMFICLDCCYENKRLMPRANLYGMSGT